MRHARSRMARLSALLAGLALGCARLLAGAQGKNEPAPDISPADSTRLGAALAADLLRQVPAENLTNTGVLRIRGADGLTRSLPVRFEILRENAGWRSTYEARDERGELLARFAVVHRPGQPNDYRLESREPGLTNPAPRELSGDKAMIPFAGSDFWLADLGLEFLHWPKQRLLRKEMRRGQFCQVLESTRAGEPADGYARVVAWIDADSGGIVLAEAYDARGKKVKVFAPKEFKKVQGQWQLQEMEISNAVTGSRTRIEFNLNPPASGG